MEECGQDDAVRITSIDLSNLALDDTRMMLADVLTRNSSDVSELAEIAHAQTNGNIFHLLQFLRVLVEQLIIERVNGQWVWDIDTLRSNAGSADSIVKLIERSILSLPAPVQEALKIASCLGDEIDASALDRVLLTPTAPMLQQASDEGLLVFSMQRGGYRFAHDLIRHVACGLIPKGQVDEINLKIGRRLLRSSNAAALEDNIMMIVSLMNVGARLITDQRERYKLAGLNLRAGRKALSIPSFPDAARYLQQGIAFLGSNCWQEQYKLSLDLYSNTAEVESINGNYDAVAPCIIIVGQHGACLDDKIQAYMALLTSMEVQDDLREATSVCIDILAQLGVRLPTRASRLTVAINFLFVRFHLRGKSDEAILNLPLMTNRRKIQAMEFLAMGFMLTWRSRSPLCAIFAYRSALMTLRFGMNEYSAIAFAVYASTLCGLRIDTKEGYRFGKLALAVSERYNSPKVVSMTNFIFGVGVIHWTRPVTELFETLNYAAKVGLDTGYLAICSQARLASNLYLHHTGKKLSLVKSRVREALNIARLYRQRISEMGLAAALQMVHCYEGTAENPCRLTGTSVHFEENLNEAFESSNKMQALLLYFFSMEIAYIHGDLPEAAKMAQLAMQQLSGSPSPTLTSVMIEFQNAMIAIASYRGGTRRIRNLKIAKGHARAIAEYVKVNPENFLHMKLLLEAELQSLQKNTNHKAVRQLFSDAFNHARTVDNLFFMALVCERWGDYLEEQGENQEALLQWKKSADIYEEWGAVVKSQKLREKLDTSCGDVSCVMWNDDEGDDTHY